MKWWMVAIGAALLVYHLKQKSDKEKYDREVAPMVRSALDAQRGYVYRP